MNTVIDPRWREISISKVGKTLWVKLPSTTVAFIRSEFEKHFEGGELKLRHDLLPHIDLLVRHARTAGASPSCIFSLSVKEASQALTDLEKIQPEGEHLKAYVSALRSGLKGLASIDWIKRMKRLNASLGSDTQPVESEPERKLF